MYTVQRKRTCVRSEVLKAVNTTAPFMCVDDAVWTRRKTIFRAEDADSMFHRNVGIYLRVYTASAYNNIVNFIAVKTSGLSLRWRLASKSW
jgi:hypothetical protein